MNNWMEYSSFSQPICMSYVALCEISSSCEAVVNRLWATIGDISASTTSWTNGSTIRSSFFLTSAARDKLFQKSHRPLNFVSSSWAKPAALMLYSLPDQSRGGTPVSSGPVNFSSFGSDGLLIGLSVIQMLWRTERPASDRSGSANSLLHSSCMHKGSTKSRPRSIQGRRPQ